MKGHNRFAWTVLVILAAGTAAGAQVAADAEAPLGPKIAAGEALKHVPADCMGFVVVNNAQDLGRKVDAFVKAISPEGKPFLPAGVVDMLKGQAGLGQGFNANGPFAVVMLDPQQFGVDLLKLMGAPGAPAEGDDDAAPAEPPMPPVVVLIPGKDPAALLAGHNPVKDGDYFKTGVKAYWRQVGPFVAGGPNKEALAAVASTAKSIAGRLSAADKALVARSDAAVWVDFKIVGPLAEAGLAGIGKMIEAEDEATGKQMAQALAMYGPFIKQLDDVAMGLRLAPKGILVEVRTSFKPDSVLGKALTAFKPVAGPLLNRLPNVPYVFALGARGMAAMPKDLNMQMFDQMMSAAMFKGLAEEDRAKLRKQAEAFQGEIDGIQICIGGSGGGSGPVALAYVLECTTSAAKVKALLPDYIASVGKLYQAMPDPNVSKVVLKYHKGLETVGPAKTPVDVISIGHPEFDKMTEDDRRKLRAVLGDDKISFMLAEADKTTLVVTLGAGKDYLAATMKTAAARRGRIAADPAAAEALAMLPRGRMAVGLLNVGNIFKVIKSVAAALDEEAPPFNIDAPVPLAGSIAIEKADVSMVGYVPTATVKNVIAGVMSMMQGPDPGPGPGAMEP